MTEESYEQGMEFRKAFPSLKNIGIGFCYGALTPVAEGNWGDVFTQDELTKHCLDKQKVKEAIEKCDKESRDAFQSMIPHMLKEELGL